MVGWACSLDASVMAMARGGWERMQSLGVWDRCKARIDKN